MQWYCFPLQAVNDYNFPALFSTVFSNLNPKLISSFIVKKKKKYGLIQFLFSMGCSRVDDMDPNLTLVVM